MNQDEAKQVIELKNEWRPTATVQRLHSYYRHLVAVDGSRVVGFIDGHHKQDQIWTDLAGFQDKPEGWTCSYFAELYVTPQYRNQKVATRLIREFEQDARMAGNDAIVTNPDASEDGLEERLREFYGKLGYVLEPFVSGMTPYLLVHRM